MSTKGNAVIGQSGGPTSVINQSLVGVAQAAVAIGVLVMSAPFTAAAIRAHRLNYVRAALYHGGLLVVAAGGAVRALDGDSRDYSAMLATGVLVLLGIALSNSWQLVISHESDNENGGA